MKQASGNTPCWLYSATWSAIALLSREVIQDSIYLEKDDDKDVGQSVSGIFSPFLKEKY